MFEHVKEQFINEFNTGNTVVEEQVPLAPFTTFKVGGPARYFLRAKRIEDVIAAIQIANNNAMPVFILGGGSNILVHDNGFPGLVIKIELVHIEIDGTKLTAGAGTLLSAAIMRTMKAGLHGLEFAIGVPASVGGAVWANLGCRGSEISSVLTSVDILDAEYAQRTLNANDCQFAYRESIFKHQPWIILQATFQLQQADQQELKHAMLDLTKRKKAEQNVGEDTAGCTFRNPVDSDKAASQLIDQLDLKGFAIGGAQVSTKHANFIINTGSATADDIVQLISYVKQHVRDKAGVQLMEEIEYIGFNNKS